MTGVGITAFGGDGRSQCQIEIDGRCGACGYSELYASEPAKMLAVGADLAWWRKP